MNSALTSRHLRLWNAAGALQHDVLRVDVSARISLAHSRTHQRTKGHGKSREQQRDSCRKAKLLRIRPSAYPLTKRVKVTSSVRESTKRL